MHNSKMLRPPATLVRKGRTTASLSNYSRRGVHTTPTGGAFYADGIAYEDVPLGRTSRGKTELRKFVEDTFASFPDLKVEVVSSSICDGHGVSEVVWSATDKGFLKTDKRFSVRMV